MKEFPKGGLIGKTVHLWRDVSALEIPVYAANASFFIVLALFPALLLFLSVLHYTPFEVEGMARLLQGLLPDVFLEAAEELILLTYDAASGVTLGLSAVTTLWSASRGIHGILTGLNGIYGLTESRSWLKTRCISMVYTFLLLLALILTLGLHVFGAAILRFLTWLDLPVLGLFLELIDLRLFVLVAVQWAVFTAMFMTLPDRKIGIRESLPGALLSSAGWLIFSNLFSVYVEYFAALDNVYGSLSVLPLGMLWLYCCMSILFYGGALNRLLTEGKL